MSRQELSTVALHATFYAGMLLVFFVVLELLPLSAMWGALVALLACVPLLYAANQPA